jgi:4-oxalocrotonate tautomerase
MPLLQLTLHSSSLSDLQRSQLSSGLTSRTASLLSKQADLTVVQLVANPGTSWSRNGEALSSHGWCASLCAYVTAGTNTKEQKSAFLASAFALLERVLGGPPTAPTYIIVQEIDAHDWGYGGLTQAARRIASPAAASTVAGSAQLT